MTPTIVPCLTQVSCTVHEPPIPSALLLAAPTSPMREVTVLAVGPDVRGVVVGQRLLANILAGVRMGDVLLLPESSLLCEVV